MRVLFCGSRIWDDPEPIRNVLQGLSIHRTTIVHGHGPGTPGADRLTDDIAHALGFKVERHPADWSRYGKAAGPKRNQAMIDSGIDLVYAFRRLNALGESRGTDDLVSRARAAQIPVFILEYGHGG